MRINCTEELRLCPEYSKCLVSGFLGGSDGKESACNAGDLSSIPGLGRSPGGGNDYPPQDSRLENSMNRGASWAIARGVAE